MSSSTIKIAKFNGSNYKAIVEGEGAHLEKKVAWGIIEGCDMKPPIPATVVIVTGIKVYKQWMNHHGIARSTILL